MYLNKRRPLPIVYCHCYRLSATVSFYPILLAIANIATSLQLMSGLNILTFPIAVPCTRSHWSRDPAEPGWSRSGLLRNPQSHTTRPCIQYSNSRRPPIALPAPIQYCQSLPITDAPNCSERAPAQWQDPRPTTLFRVALSSTYTPMEAEAPYPGLRLPRRARPRPCPRCRVGNAISWT